MNESIRRVAGPPINTGLLFKLRSVTKLQIQLPESLSDAATQRITTSLLGKAKVPGVAYEQADGTPFSIDIDYFGKERSKKHPTPGPLENPGTQQVSMEIR